MDFVRNIFFSEVNLPLTILLGLLVLYWIFTMVSGFDLDFGLDMDVDVDVDVDVDADVDADSSAPVVDNINVQDLANAEMKDQELRRRGKLNWFQIFLVYFNFVGLPFMFTFTAWVLAWWGITVTLTYWTHTYENSIGVVILLSAMIPALFIAKWFSSPFKRFFRNFNPKGEAALDMEGRIAVLNSNLEGDRTGTALVTIEGSPITVYVRSLDGNKIAASMKVLIIKRSRDKKYYYVESYK